MQEKEVSKAPQSFEEKGVNLGNVWKWLLAVIFLALVSICTGTPNLYPTFKADIMELLGISSSTAVFMCTGGVMILYITLPAGLFIDKFGGTLALLVSVILTIVPYVIMLFCKSIPGLFITLYLIGAFGSSSLFITCLQIALAKAPLQIKGVSVSVVSAALSLSFGLWLQIFQLGGKAFSCDGSCTMEGFNLVTIAISVIIFVSALLAWFFYKDFNAYESTLSNDSSQEEEKADSQQDQQQSSEQSVKKGFPWYILKDYRLYLLGFMMLLTVFDGQTILSGGTWIWTLYGNSEGSATYGTAFSVTNCICTIVISIVIDAIVSNLHFTRTRVIATFWICLIIPHILVTIVFSVSKSTIAFGVVSSMMGIPFGFGLSNIPALTSEIFGNENYGFAFGIIQIGSIISAASAMSIIESLGRAGVIGMFIVLLVLRVISGIPLFFSHAGSLPMLDNDVQEA